MRANDVREKFLKFFESKGHTRVASSSLVPEGDSTLLFTNAGMNQFKGLFLGEEKRPYSRATTSQKCVRAGGKHNDLENVGFTSRHHTFFEMLGNFSFGDYFKEDAIAFCWELLTRDLGLDKSKLYVTIYKTDDDAEKIWKKVTGFGTDKILRFGEKENFWSMGDTGPCGPCSEVHYDQGKELTCGRPDCGVNCPSDVCDRYLEIWNNVFMEFERSASGNMTKLPKPSIDTGMGLERITSIMQGKKSNYEIDLFQGIIATVAEIAKKKYGADKNADSSMRVIADHARATAFLVGDGVLPSNEGRGYVLRRIMRRAIRHAWKLDIKQPRFDEVVNRVIDEMGSAYPDLVTKRDSVRETTKREDTRFRETLETGIKLLSESFKKGGTSVPGDVAFKLHDTYGFPIDLTQVIAQEHGFAVDSAGYEKRMEEQKQRGKDSWKGDGAGGERALITETATKEAKDAMTRASFTPSHEGSKLTDALEKAGTGDLKDEFLRWAKAPAATTLGTKSRVLVTLKADGTAGPLAKGDVGALVSWWSPFYGEGGGQIGDRGEIRGENGARFEVADTQKLAGDGTLPPIHFGRVVEGQFRAKDTVELEVSNDHRNPTRAHHTATHLMHSGLRNVLGTHVKQAGSVVGPDRLRFDFAHTKPVTREELRKIEREVNDVIFRNLDAVHREMPYQEAIAAGALAFFGDKYGERVKMLTIGDYSKELCGGTHVSSTGEIGFFRFLGEEGIAAGVRRVEAVTNASALAHSHAQEDVLLRAADILKSAHTDVPDRIEKLVDENKRLLKEMETLRSAVAAAAAGDLVSKARDIKGMKILAEQVSIDPAQLREFAEKLLDKLKSGVVVLGAKSADGKGGTLFAAVTKDLQSKVQAGAIIKEITTAVGGRGGGKPDSAQGSAPDAEKIPAAIQAALDLLGR